MPRAMVLAFGFLSAFGGSAAWGASAADMSAVSALTDDVGFSAAMRAREAGDFAGALVLLNGVILRHPGEAEAWSQHGFAARKTGALEISAASYEKALSVDPDHLGALEYQGELFVTLGDEAAALANLARLQTLCGDCEELLDLQEAISAAAQ